MREKCPYSEFSGPFFPAYVFSTNAGKYEPGKLAT